ncbi:hypothetical protein MMC18_007570 [Xylographa bjoerkii]|nr:hypothetical protein [Xylographa bjoerkii]
MLPAARKVITQQDGEIPVSQITPDVLLARDLVTEFSKPGSNNGAALIIASIAGDLPTVERLSKVQKDAHQNFPLQEMLVAAALRSHTKVVEYCLQQGAVIDDDVNFAAFRGLTADLFEAMIPRNIFNTSQHPEYLSQLLFHTAGIGPFPRRFHSTTSDSKGVRLATALLAHGAKIDKDIVFRAAENQSVAFMKCLLAHGAALEGSGALHYAAVRGRLEMMGWLLDHGADVNELLPKDILGDMREPAPQMGSPLHYAVHCGEFDAVMLLLERGGDMTLRNKYGQNALEVERTPRDEESHLEITQLLRYVQEHILKVSSGSTTEQELKENL